MVCRIAQNRTQNKLGVLLRDVVCIRVDLWAAYVAASYGLGSGVRREFD